MTTPSCRKDYNFVKTIHKTYVCEICEKALSLEERFSKLNISYVKGKETKYYVCEYCVKTLLVKEIMTKNSKENDDELNVCEVCGGIFSLNKFLKKHDLVYVGNEKNKPIVCDKCIKSLSKEDNLKIFGLTHEKLAEKLHECNMCSTKFILERNLKTHKLICEKNRKHKNKSIKSCSQKNNVLNSLSVPERSSDLHRKDNLFYSTSVPKGSYEFHGKNNLPHSASVPIKLFEVHGKKISSHSTSVLKELSESYEKNNLSHSSSIPKKLFKSYEKTNLLHSTTVSKRLSESCSNNNLSHSTSIPKKSSELSRKNNFSSSKNALKRLSKICEMCEADILHSAEYNKPNLCMTCKERLLKGTKRDIEKLETTGTGCISQGARFIREKRLSSNTFGHRSFPTEAQFSFEDLKSSNNKDRIEIYI